MGRRPLTKPRKIASQERSRAPVDVLVEATARILVKEGFDKTGTNRITEAAGENYALFSTYLESHREELRVDDLGLASFISVTAIEALTHNAVLHYSKVLSDEAMEALIDEGARLVTGYLERR